MTSRVPGLVLPAFLLASATGALAGCSGDGKTPLTGARVTGTIKYQGKVVTGGQVRLISLDDRNKSMAARIDGNGRYDLPNAPTGPVKVVVDTNPAKSDPSALAAKSGGAIDPSAYGTPVKFMPIDTKYAGFESTDYLATVEKGDQTIDIDLK